MLDLEATFLDVLPPASIAPMPVVLLLHHLDDSELLIATASDLTYVEAEHREVIAGMLADLVSEARNKGNEPFLRWARQFSLTIRARETDRFSTADVPSSTECLLKQLGSHGAVRLPKNAN